MFANRTEAPPDLRQGMGGPGGLPGTSDAVPMVREAASGGIRRGRLVLLLQLAGTLLILSFVPSNPAKAILLPCWWLLTFGRSSRSEPRLFIGGAVLFAALDVLAVRNGAFAFHSPDVLGLPWWEFLMWGFYLVHMLRMTGGRVTADRQRLGSALVLAAIFAVAFSVAPDPLSRLVMTTVALAGALWFFHSRDDLLRVGYMILLGAAVEYVGVWSGLWSYPNAPAGGVPLWFVPMWAGVGLFAGRVAEPLLNAAPRPEREAS